jgi:hypothetical protein
MTTRDEAKRTALAYAWGREDASGTPTAVPSGGAAAGGDWAFSEAYAQGQLDYNEQRRGDMIPVRDAYANWQDSGGKSVFRRGELTLSDIKRTELREHWPDLDRSPEAYAAYYALRDQMQAAAWDALP